MSDVIVQWIDDQTISVRDADDNELWRGDWHAIELLRELVES